MIGRYTRICSTVRAILARLILFPWPLSLEGYRAAQMVGLPHLGDHPGSTHFFDREIWLVQHTMQIVSTARAPSVAANTMVRRMSGGTQAHLIGASDRRYYVVKFINNPQHRRILVNELLSSFLLKHLGLPTPPVALVTLDAQFIGDNSEAHIQGRHERLPPPVAQHFGSCYPGSPLRDVVYDVLPDVILLQVANIEAFLGIL